jgi:hypothetical protein
MIWEFLLYCLIGLGIGLVIFPIWLSILNLFRKTFERRRIKKMLKKGQFLVTIDTRDYDYKQWQGKKYGNIDVEENKKYLLDLNKKIFKKVNQNNEFFNKVLIIAKELKNRGYTDDMLMNEFKKKNYNDDLIKQIFQEVK